MKFKACEVRKTAAYYGVCEDFEDKRNAEIRFLFTLEMRFGRFWSSYPTSQVPPRSPSAGRA